MHHSLFVLQVAVKAPKNLDRTELKAMPNFLSILLLSILKIKTFIYLEVHMRWSSLTAQGCSMYM
jgi:hypothetical protein